MMHRTMTFLGGMIGTILLFIAMTLIVAHVRSDCGIMAVLGRLQLAQSGCADDIIRVGFPFLFWEEGGMAYHSVFSFGALLLNCAIALAISILVGWLCQRQLRRS